MKRISVLVALLAFLSFPIWAEEDAEVESSKVNLGVSYGFGFPKDVEVDLPKLMVRNRHDALAVYTNWHLDVTSEFFFGKQMLSLSVGARLTDHSAILEKDWDYLYWLVKEGETTCDYISMTLLGQRNYYVGIPLAMRIFCAPVQCRVRPYVRVEGAFDFLVSNRNGAIIWNDRMARLYEQSIKDQLGSPEKFHASISASGGIRIRCNNYFYVNPEIILPKFELGESPVSFIQAGNLRCNGGLKVSVQFPIGANGERAEQVESTYNSDIQGEKEMPSEDF